MLNPEEEKMYWNGGENKLIRYYFYLQRGLLVLNEFRYLIMAILAVYALLDMKDPLVMVLMFVIALPVLAIIGWFYTFKMAKVMDFLNIKFSTHYGKYSIELQEKQLNELKDLNRKASSTYSKNFKMSDMKGKWWQSVQ